jgi:hypothetical protein
VEAIELALNLAVWRWKPLDVAKKAATWELALSLVDATGVEMHGCNLGERSRLRERAHNRWRQGVDALKGSDR